MCFIKKNTMGMDISHHTNPYHYVILILKNAGLTCDGCVLC